MGARIDALYPLGPVFHGAGLNITVMSNNGQMHVGIIACRELMPQVWQLAEHFPAELAALAAAAVAAVAPEKAAPKKKATPKKKAAPKKKATKVTGATKASQPSKAHAGR
jgi:diacylglycerol O-acyltransferase